MQHLANRSRSVAISLSVASILTVTTAPAVAADFLPVGARARITVDFSYESSDQSPDRKVHEWNWKARRTLHIETIVAAKKPDWMPGSEPMDAQQIAAGKNAQANSLQAFNNAAPMMAAAQAAFAKCGNNEACITAEVMKMSAMPEAAQSKAPVASTEQADRYQRFEPVSQTESYSIDETADMRDRDPLYIGWPQDTRIQTDERKGGGAVVPPPGTDPKVIANFKGTGNVERDAQKNTLIITMPTVVWPLPYTEHVMSSEKSGRMVDRGTTQKMLTFRNSESEYTGDPKMVKVEVKGDWKNQSGSYTVKQPGPRWNGGVMTVRWKFETL